MKRAAWHGTGSGGKRARAYATKGPGKDRPGRGRHLCEIGRDYESLRLAAILRAWHVASPQRPLLTLERVASLRKGDDAAAADQDYKDHTKKLRNEIRPSGNGF